MKLRQLRPKLASNILIVIVYQSKTSPHSGKHHMIQIEFMPHQAGHRVLIFATDTQEVWYSIDLLSLLLRATYKWRNAWSCSKYWDVLFGSRRSIFTFRIRYKKPIIDVFVVNCSPVIQGGQNSLRKSSDSIFLATCFIGITFSRRKPASVYTR